MKEHISDLTLSQKHIVKNQMRLENYLCDRDRKMKNIHKLGVIRSK